MLTSTDVDRLVEEVKWFLSEVKEPVSEHDLIAEFAYEKAFAELPPGSAIRLQSQRHFLIMHVLYKLRDELDGVGRRLQMRPDAICLLEPNAASSEIDDAGEFGQTGLVNSEEQLRDYYLDLAQLDLTESGTSDPSGRDLSRSPDLYSDEDWCETHEAHGEKCAEAQHENTVDFDEFRFVNEDYQALQRYARY